MRTAIVMLIVASVLTHAARADVTQPEGELPSCEVPGITVPRERTARFDPMLGTRVAAVRSSPTC